MTRISVDDFAEALVRLVRDAAIANCDRLLSGTKGPRAAAWNEAIDDDSRGGVAYVIPDIVDETVYVLLRAIDEGALPLHFIPDGESCDLTAEGRGELAGWYMGANGWRAQHSRERLNDYNRGLKLKLD